MTPDTDDSPKRVRIILYCPDCKWAKEVTDDPKPPFKCPTEGNGLSYVKFHEHEKAVADEVLRDNIGKGVDEVAAPPAPEPSP